MFQSRPPSLFENDSRNSVETNSATAAKLDVATLLFGLFGFGVALYALLEHIQAKAGDAGNLQCDVNEVVSCSNVLTSEYGEFLGIPLGAYGMAFWGGVIGLALLPKMVEVSRRYIANWRLVAASAGVVVAIALAYLSYFVIQSVCLICTTTQLICVAFFIFAVASSIKRRREAAAANPNAFPKLIAVGLALAVPPLLAGLIAPGVMVDIIKKKKSETKVSAQSTPAPSATPFPAEWVVVNKSNYVGNGEDYRKGNDNAKVILQVFTDPQCPACRVAAQAIDAAMQSVGLENVLYVSRLYPLDNSCNPKAGPLHPRACALSTAARCAGQQGKFWEMLHWAYDSQTLPTASMAAAYSDGGIRSHAQKLGLNLKAFQACLESKVETKKIESDIELGTRMGLRGTPMVIINGKHFQGNHGDPSSLAAALRAEMINP
jgi:protein-disulfide isomerase